MQQPEIHKQNQQNKLFKLASYSQQKLTWPKQGQHILAQFNQSTIIVYQAYNPVIAIAIVQSQNFHSEQCKAAGYSMKRMTWIKPNFLWMMYRSGWATKKDQERILAIRLKRQGFQEMLTKAILSKVDDTKGDKPSKQDEVRLQWDPDHLPNGAKHQKRRAIQLGLRGEMLLKMSKQYIVKIDDITQIVQNNRAYIQNDQKLRVPVEEIYYLQDQKISESVGKGKL